MYTMRVGVDKPDIEYLKTRVEELMKRGIAIKDLRELRTKCTKKRNNLLTRIQNELKIENPNSSQQVKSYFVNKLDEELRAEFSGIIVQMAYRIAELGYKEVPMEPFIGKVDNPEQACKDVNSILGHPIIKYMFNDRKWTTDKIALESMDRFDGNLILEYRKAKKEMETIESLSNEMVDGRIHPIVSLGKTNRINYAKPALMNIPKEMVWDIISPINPNNLLFSIDIKQQEPWIVIHYLGIESLKEKIEQGDDLYEEIFGEMFNRKPDKVERKELKQSWNAMTYGAYKKGISDICRNIDANVVYEYFNSIPEFKEYKNRCQRLAKRDVQVVYSYFGTELVANEFGSKLSRVLMDLPIQGTGADILALLVKRFDDYIEANDLGDCLQLYYTRHDEAIIEVSREYVDTVGVDSVEGVLRDIFEHRIDDWEPFRCEINVIGS